MSFSTDYIVQTIEEARRLAQQVHDNSFDVLAHHLVGLTMQLGEVTVDLAYKIISQA